MYRILFLFILLSSLFQQGYAKESQMCIRLVDIIEAAQENKGVVLPLEPRSVRMFVQLKLLPSFALQSPESFYIEDRGINQFRVFNMIKGCADKQWFFPSDFLYLLGLRKT